MQNIDIYLRLPAYGAKAVVVDSQNKPLNLVPRIVRGVQTAVRLHIFANASATAQMAKSALPYASFVAFVFHTWEGGVTPCIRTNSVSVSDDGTVVCSFAETNTEQLAEILDRTQGRMLWFELDGYASGSDVADFVVQFQVVCENRGDSAAGEPTPVEGAFYTKEQCDALFGHDATVFATREWAQATFSSVTPYKLPVSTSDAFLGDEESEWSAALPDKLIAIHWESGQVMSFPTLLDAGSDEMLTTEVWVRFPSNSGEGVLSIYVPDSYAVVGEDVFPTSLHGVAGLTEWTWHVFVLRRGRGVVTLSYSHHFETNGGTL